jgi:hypothetical protein
MLGKGMAGACTVGILGLIWLPCEAEAARTPMGAPTRLVADHNKDGNGHHNATATSVRSPIRNRGYQHTTNRNAGGVTDAQNALCHNVRVCNVRQQVTMVGPERTAPPVPPASPAPPAAPDTTVAPQTGTAAPGGPLLYMGPYGLMFTGAGSGQAAGDAGGRTAWFECPADLFS